MLLKNQVAFAQSSHEITDEEKQEASKNKVQLKQIPVAIDGVAIAVNPGLNLPTSISFAELNGIYTGAIKNWRDIGGDDLPIHPYSRSEKSGTVLFFERNVLNNNPINFQVVKIAKSSTEAFQRLSDDKGAIYFASASEVIGKYGQCTIKPLALRVGNMLFPPHKESTQRLCPNQPQSYEPNIDAFRNQNYPLTRKMYIIVKQDGSNNELAGEAYADFLLKHPQLIEQAGFASINPSN